MPHEPARMTVLGAVVLAADAGERKPVASLLLLVVGTIAVYWALDHRRWEVAAVGLAAAGVTSWLLTNTPYEGAVLLVPFHGNGLTAADLLCGPAVVLSALLSWRAARKS